MKPQIFIGVGCLECGGLQIGRSDDKSMEYIPIFRNRMLAEMFLAGRPVNIEHPQSVISIYVTMLVPQPPPTAP